MPYRRRRLSSGSEEDEVRPVRRRRVSVDHGITYHHILVFLITFFSFAFVHAARKTLSTVKGSLIAVWTHNATQERGPLFPDEHAAENFLALLDFGFLFAYAIGLYIGGILGDRYNPRIVLSIGIWLSATVVFLFGYVTELFRLYSVPVYFLLWVSGGLFQSVAWPTEIAIVGNWFGRGSRGLILGAWSACASVGNIIGTVVTSWVVEMGYQYAFMVNSMLLFGFGFVVFLCLSTHPRDIGLPEPVEWSTEGSDLVEEREGAEPSRPVGFWRAWKLPGVLPYSLAYACLKLVTYGFFFWLPFYLHSHFGLPESDADRLSIYYDCGGIIAAILGGALSDRMASRTPVVVGMLLISSLMLAVYSAVSGAYLVNALMLAVVGFFTAGPANMISASVAADLGKARQLRGSTDALSTVTGIVDGTGSVGAAFGMLLIPLLQRWIGWAAVFYGFIVMVLCTALCLAPLLYREWRERRGYVDEEEEQRTGENSPLLA